MGQLVMGPGTRVRVKEIDDPDYRSYWNKTGTVLHCGPHFIDEWKAVGVAAVQLDDGGQKNFLIEDLIVLSHEECVQPPGIGFFQRFGLACAAFWTTFWKVLNAPDHR